MQDDDYRETIKINQEFIDSRLQIRNVYQVERIQGGPKKPVPVNDGLPILAFLVPIISPQTFQPRMFFRWNVIAQKRGRNRCRKISLRLFASKPSFLHLFARRSGISDAVP